MIDSARLDHPVEAPLAGRVIGVFGWRRRQGQ
jgi:hypothetical protein